ncbi:MAG: hypothetical protein IJB52_16990 [Clostridia bacterium]|nr:hypothetical protein [Clostridia bacterium]
MGLDTYIAAYRGEYPFVPAQTIAQEIRGVECTVEVLRYEREGADSIWEGREIAHVTLRKGTMTYTCVCTEGHFGEAFFHPVTLAGETYLCFRKTLYGFTLLHTETFAERDYFPEKVLLGEESFIMADAVAVDNLLFFYGCYWACPYFYVIYDPASGRFLDLWDLYRVEFDGNIRVEGEKILFPYRDMEEQKTVVLTIPEIRKLLAEKGTGDM